MKLCQTIGCILAGVIAVLIRAAKDLGFGAALQKEQIEICTPDEIV